jgi:hypothetical protein
MANQWFIDESFKHRFVLVATEVSNSEVNKVRPQLKSLLNPHQSHLHMKKESAAKQREILKFIGGLDLQHYAVSLPTALENISRARQLALELLALHVRTSEISRITLDESTHKQRDVRTIDRHFNLHPVGSISHVPTRNEPMLWIPDAVAWSLTRGGDFDAAKFDIKIMKIELVS